MSMQINDSLANTERSTPIYYVLECPDIWMTNTEMFTDSINEILRLQVDGWEVLHIWTTNMEMFTDVLDVWTKMKKFAEPINAIRRLQVDGCSIVRKNQAPRWRAGRETDSPLQRRLWQGFGKVPSKVHLRDRQSRP